MQITKHSGRRRAIIAGGALLGVAALTTAAALQDNAYLNLGGAGDGNGSFGTVNKVNIRVVQTNADFTPKYQTFAAAKAANAWQEANDPAGVSFAIVGADALMPGSPDWKSVNIPFINDEESPSANLDVTLVDKGGDAVLRDALRFTVSVDGTPLPGLTNVPYSTVVNKSMGGRVASGSGGVLSVSVNVPDQGSDAANNAIAGKTARIQAHVHAEG